MPKLSLVPCRTSLGAVGANSSAARDFSGRPGRCSGNARHTIAAGFVSEAVRQATRAPALRPPTTSGCCGPLLLDEPAQRGKPGLVQLAAVARQRLRPAVRQGCSNRTTVVPSAGKTSGQQLKISSGDAATCAMAEHQDRTRLLGKIDKEPARPLRGSDHTRVTIVEVMIRSASPDQALARARR